MTDTLREKLKAFQPAAEKRLFPFVLFFYPFFGVWTGVDVTDTMYALTYYAHGNTLDRMWYFATYLPNLTGRLLMHLPFGGTMLGIGIYCTLFVSLTALFTYYMLQFFDLPGWMVFAGLFLAESLCWAPEVILYHYLSHIFFTAGTLILVRALSAPVAQKRLLFLSGALFGLNIMVRMPNVLQIAILIVIFGYGIWAHKNKLTMCREAGVFLGGYITGFFIPFASISLLYDREAYVRMTRDLFSMTSGSPSHSAAGMLALIGGAYKGTILHMAIMIPCIAAGCVMFFLWKDKFIKQKIALYLAGVVVLMVYFFRRGVFTMNYWYYDSIFQASMMFLICAIVLFVLDIAGVLRGHEHERMLSLAALVILLITPLGSNNYTYPAINNLFFVAPVALCVLRRAMRRASKSALAREHFTWESIVLAITAVLFVQGILFHAIFSFRDGTDGTPRNVRITQIPRLAHMVTTGENANRLTGLYVFLTQGGFSGREAITFGNIPGVVYFCDLTPAIFTTWPDLPSNTTQRFNDALDALETPPLIIIGRTEDTDVTVERKSTYLQMYRMQHTYEKIYDDGYFEVYEAQ
ncbi:MAG: hypothetical protein IJQ12_06070 [Lachnospiraceae bacterium]|nr:hypothetical protein [Lachnospiraceae bacterium]